MELSQLNCSRGAPLGRREHHAYGMDDLEFELEWVPFVDDCYDYGGAYWGLPANLYCAVAVLDGEELVRMFLRASCRADAMAGVREEYPEATFQPRNGSLVKATIAFLRECQAQETDEPTIEAIGEDIDALVDWLEERNLNN